jgi:hypothetical protein
MAEKLKNLIKAKKHLIICQFLQKVSYKKVLKNIKKILPPSMVIKVKKLSIFTKKNSI